MHILPILSLTKQLKEITDMTKMKAALMYGPNDIRVEMTEKPTCPKDGMILKIMAVGLCG